MSRLIVNGNQPKGKINKNIYGHFSEHLGRCIYGGYFVGEDSEIPNENGIRKDVVEAMKKIRVPVLRWPGGCFADEYHWKDGIGPKETRKKMINTHWGGVVEDNSFGTHEFMELCRQLGCEPYVNMNVGSGTVQEMSEWVEYLNFDGLSPMTELRKKNGREKAWGVKYIGVGNENWGCGGQMRPEFYADQYRRYATYVRTYGDNAPFKIACGPNVDDYKWTQELMKQVADVPFPDFMRGLTLHYYTVPGDDWQHKGSATDFDEKMYYRTIHRGMRMDELIENHKRIMQHYDPTHRVGLIVDEWGAWYDQEPGSHPGFLYQLNTMRDALLAAVTLNIFNKHCDRVIMANLAQTINVLQAIILTEGEQMLLTPTYHVFDLYKDHQDATLLESYIETKMIGEGEDQIPNLSVSASRKDNGDVTVTIANLSATEGADIETELPGIRIASVEAEILGGDIHALNTFDNINAVHTENYDDGKVENGTIKFKIPKSSIIALHIKQK